MDPDQNTRTSPAADVRMVIPSVYAAAQCAQSCIRFWNLLLQDTASVSPFGFSIDGYDRSDDEDEDEENEEEDEENMDTSKKASDNEEDDMTYAVPKLGSYGDGDYQALMAIIQRPGSYMKPSTLHWWNHHVGFAKEDDPNYADVFRLPLGFFTTVCGLCREDMQQGDIPASLRNVEGRIMSVERQVAIAVMRLATGYTLKSVSQLLGCGLSTVVKIVYKFIASVRHNAASFLQWPSSEDSLTQVKNGFLQKHGLPNCCGAMDASHIVMELPSGEPADLWNNRFNSFSMILQAIIDSDLRFLDVCVGLPGSLTNVRCLRESSIYKKCCQGQRLNGYPLQIGELSIGEYVVGDFEYPLLAWLMKPYAESELTMLSRLHYNERLNSTRVVVARAFGRLKGTWRILQGTMKQPNIERVPKMIHACCILHNICINAGGVEGIHIPESEALLQNDFEDFSMIEDELTYEAYQTRENLCTYLAMAGQG